MSVSAQEQLYIRSSKRFQPSNSMRSKVIPSWKVQKSAQTHHFPTPWKYFSPRLYLYSCGQKVLKSWTATTNRVYQSIVMLLLGWHWQDSQWHPLPPNQIWNRQVICRLSGEKAEKQVRTLMAKNLRSTGVHDGMRVVRMVQTLNKTSTKFYENWTKIAEVCNWGAF